MPDTTSASLQIIDQVTGGNENTWGDIADSNFAKLEQAIAQVSSISVNGGSVTLDDDTRRKAILVFSGTLASDQTVVMANAQKAWHVRNSTTGNFKLTIKTAAGAGVIIPRGPGIEIYCDGADVNLLRSEKIPFAVAAGSADVITAAFMPAITASDLVDGFIVAVRASFANATTTPTFNPDTLGAGTIKKFANQALVVGDVFGAGHICLFLYNSATSTWSLLNPSGTILGLNNAWTGINSFSKLATFNAVAFAEQTLTVSLGIASWDMSLARNALVNLTVATTTLASPTNQAVGQEGIVRFVEDSTGGRLLSFDTYYKLVSDAFYPAPNRETEYFYKVVASSGVNSIELRAKTRAKVTLPTQNASSGTAIDFPNIPAWAKKITIDFGDLSTNGVSNYLVQIGNGAAETSGYSSASINVGGANTGPISAGFVIFSNTAATNASGTMTLTNTTGNTWIEEHALIAPTPNNYMMGAGKKTTSGIVNFLRVTSETPNTFDGGSITVIVED